MKKLLVAAAVAAAACGPSVKPQLKAEIDSTVARYTGSARAEDASGAEPMAWEVGQWALYKVVRTDAPPSIQRMSVTGREAGGLWIETVNQDYYHRTITRVLYQRMPRSADELFDVVLKTTTKQDNEPAQTMDFTDTTNPMIGMMKSMWRSSATGTFVPQDLGSYPREDVTVPAGTFRGCYKITAVAKVLGVTSESTGFYHPSVPVSGMVRSATSDGKWQWELLDFGMQGAKSEL